MCWSHLSGRGSPTALPPPPPKHAHVRKKYKPNTNSSMLIIFSYDFYMLQTSLHDYCSMLRIDFYNCCGSPQLILLSKGVSCNLCFSASISMHSVNSKGACEVQTMGFEGSFSLRAFWCVMCIICASMSIQNVENMEAFETRPWASRGDFVCVSLVCSVHQLR